MKNVLRAVALTGILGIAAAGAQAQVSAWIGFGGPAPVYAVPPCPGVGYVWAPGYYAEGYWVPGQWVYGGYDRFDGYRGYDRDDAWRGDRYDHHDRGWNRGRYGDHFRERR